MIRLDTYQRKLQALLGGAVTTNQPTAVVCYTDKENENQKKFFVESFVATLNNATPVDICPAPDKAMVREIDSIHIRNNDTVAATVTVRVDDNGTSYEIVEVSVAAGETLLYTKDNGWSVISVYGQQTAVFNYIDFVSGTFPDAAQRLKWNDTDGTLEVGLKGGNVNLSVGLEEAIIAKEASNGGIEVGKVYYFVGSDGSNKTVAKARANSMAQAELCLGIAAESSTGGNKAFICTFGLVRNINTNHLTEGAPVYLSAATAGELTATIPASPNYVVFVGYCIRKSATVGSVFVSINSGTHLEYLHDVKLTSPVGNNEVIIYDSALGYWKNSSLSAFGVSSFSAGTTGLTPNTATTGAVTLAGTLDVDNGGTGQSSYTVGDILYASGTTALSKLAGVATGNALISGGVGVAPSWGKIGLTTHVTGTLPTANGGTNLTSFTANGVVYASSTSALATGSTFVFDGTNVGIGTSSPNDKTEVYGTAAAGNVALRVVNTATDGYSTVRLGDANGAVFRCGSTQNGYAGANSLNLWTLSTHPIGFSTNNLLRMIVDGSGNVGIGVTPSFKLDIKGGAGNGKPAQRWEVDGGSGIYVELERDSGGGGTATFGTATNHNLNFKCNDANVMFLTAGGNVGIGKTSAGAKLEILGADNLAGSTTLKVFSNNASSWMGLSYSQISTDGDFGIAINGSSTRVITVSSAGNLSINTTSVTVGYLNTDGGAAFENAGTNGCSLFLSRKDNIPAYINTNADRTLVSCRRSGTEVGTISVTTTATAYNTSSDYRLKENVEPMTGAMDKISQLSPCTFTWKSTQEPGQGFIAHELQAVFPDAVKGEKDEVDEDGNPIYQGVDTSFLVATLVKAIQELKAEFDAYKASHP